MTGIQTGTHTADNAKANEAPFLHYFRTFSVRFSLIFGTGF
ncbi:MAG: hypothetical protein RIB47_07755 [Cyclobacteriaceae bacterium]